MKTEINLIQKSKQEYWKKDQNFSIISYDTKKNSLLGPTINLIVSHQKWMERKNKAPVDTKAIMAYIEQNGQKFIEEKINNREILFFNKLTPELEPKYYEI